MRVRLLVFAALAAAVVPGLALGESAVTKYKLVLTGGAPEAGDADGTGSAVITVGDRGIVCWRIRFRAIDRPTAGHVHKGAAGATGPVSVGLGSRFRLAGCVRGVPNAVIRDIIGHPSDFYVNVHTVKFSHGAIRGQLA